MAAGQNGASNKGPAMAQTAGQAQPWAGAMPWQQGQDMWRPGATGSMPMPREPAGTQDPWTPGATGTMPMPRDLPQGYTSPGVLPQGYTEPGTMPHPTNPGPGTQPSPNSWRTPLLNAVSSTGGGGGKGQGGGKGGTGGQTMPASPWSGGVLPGQLNPQTMPGMLGQQPAATSTTPAATTQPAAQPQAPQRQVGEILSPGDMQSVPMEERGLYRFDPDSQVYIRGR